MPITSAQTKRKLRAAGRRGRAKQAKAARLHRRSQVRRVLEAANGHLLNVAELEGVEKVGTQYRLNPEDH